MLINYISNVAKSVSECFCIAMSLQTQTTCFAWENSPNFSANSIKPSGS